MLKCNNRGHIKQTLILLTTGCAIGHKHSVSIKFFNISELPRPRRRLTELMVKTSLNPSPPTENVGKQWELRFLRSPIEFLPDPSGKKLQGVKLVINTLKVNFANKLFPIFKKIS